MKNLLSMNRWSVYCCLIAVLIAGTIGSSRLNAQENADAPKVTAPSGGEVEGAKAKVENAGAEAAEVKVGAEAEGKESHSGAPNVHVLWILPFALLLGSIAICPLINMHFWEHNYPWFAIVLGAITAVYYMFVFDDPNAKGAWLHEMQEYVSFIALLGSLYIVSGGIVINVSKKATPALNTSILAIGAVIANIFGTTGAAMLLIRPFIRINKNHIKPYQIVFFIFLVANCGGSLTPIGDPPLFMGFLKGIPFFWVLKALWPMWLMVCVILLIVFFVIDTMESKKAPREEVETSEKPFSMIGIHNYGFVLMILVGVFQDSLFHMIHEGHYATILISREVIMGVAALLSLKFTAEKIYEHNEFNYEPIKEVAILFIGIFSTMVPALNYLNNNSETMPLKTVGNYYFITGGLSAVLDNAPTYLVFLETKRGNVTKAFDHEIKALTAMVEAERKSGKALTESETTAIIQTEFAGVKDADIAKSTADIKIGMTALKRDHGYLFDTSKEVAPPKISSDATISLLTDLPELSIYLIAISIGSVFFGACTYIGNGPNFMVKSIAESAHITMPSFFGYAFKYAIPTLVPIYIVVWLVFLSGWVM